MVADIALITTRRRFREGNVVDGKGSMSCVALDRWVNYMVIVYLVNESYLSHDETQFSTLRGSSYKNRSYPFGDCFPNMAEI
jgi:hypothetical protein